MGPEDWVGGCTAFEVFTASHGTDALMQYSAHGGNFGALLVDNDMPQMNGLELVRSVREMGFKGHIVVISDRLKAENLHATRTAPSMVFIISPLKWTLLATMLLQAD